MRLAEVRKPKTPSFTDEDAQLAKQAFTFVLAVQKRLEAHDEGWMDDGSYGGTGIYMSGISFRWFYGQDSNIERDQLVFAKKVIADELKRRPLLKAYLTPAKRNDDAINLEWTFEHNSAKYHSFWAAYSAKFNNAIDYLDMKKVMSNALDSLSQAVNPR